METWDIVLLVVAGYVATFGLARLMTRRREHLIGRFREQMEEGKSGASSDQTDPSVRRAA